MGEAGGVGRARCGAAFSVAKIKISAPWSVHAKCSVERWGGRGALGTAVWFGDEERYFTPGG